jgi:hypothetical protein
MLNNCTHYSYIFILITLPLHILQRNSLTTIWAHMKNNSIYAKLTMMNLLYITGLNNTLHVHVTVHPVHSYQPIERYC